MPQTGFFMAKLEKTADTKRNVIVEIVQKPLKYLQPNRLRGKSCLDCIIFLRQVRKEIKSDPDYAIDNPDPNFAQFHRFSNGTVEHYVALFTMLKAAGFTQIEVKIALQ